ncbi:GIN domain-containing protein [Pseudobacteriovorax antillogorgiicola]|nr:DUF2807 domain-containing protein [Pseudobacteriovorax antillogorgiicola]
MHAMTTNLSLLLTIVLLFLGCDAETPNQQNPSPQQQSQENTSDGDSSDQKGSQEDGAEEQEEEKEEEEKKAAEELAAPKPPKLVNGGESTAFNCEDGNVLAGNGNDLETARDIDPYTGIRINQTLRVAVDPTVQAGQVLLRGDSNLHDRVTSNVNGGDLTLSFLEGCYRYAKLHILVNPANLDSITLDGASTFVTRKNLSSDALNVEVNGASTGWVSGGFESLIVLVDGASNLDMTGRATSIEAEIRGASEGQLEKLVADSVAIIAAGVSNVSVKANKELKVNASGISTVIYEGDVVSPEITTESNLDTVERK